MRKILGLDLGVNSIGWAVVQLNNEQNKGEILGQGVRIVPLSSNERDEFSSGNAISKNRDRTLKRGARRNNQRYKQRRAKLLRFLVEHKLEPDNNLLLNLTALELYGLREKALLEPLSKQELGRVLFHLNQKRGYRSNSKSQQEESGDYLAAIAERHAFLDLNNITIGVYIFQELQKNRHFSTKNNVFYRKDYLAEFNRIWEFQKQFHPELQQESLKKEIRDNIIFFQRPLKSQKELVSDCRYEKYHKAAPKSSPIFQAYKIWQVIPNIQFKNDLNEVFLLTSSQQKDLFDYLDNHAGITQRDLLKRYGFNSRQFRVNYEKIEGNTTKIKVLKALEDAGVEAPDRLLRFDPLASEPDKEPFYRIWHLLYSVEDNNEAVIRALVKDFNLKPEQAEKIALIGFPKGFGSLSARAMRKLLPHLMKGKSYDQACNAVGYNHSDSFTLEQIENRSLKDRLEVIHRKQLRQPVVEKIVNQAIHLVNELIASPEFGKPDEIRIELARELRQNAKKRAETTKRLSAQDREHKFIREQILSEFPYFKSVTRAVLEKYKLYQETDGFSIYTGKKMDLAGVLNGDGYDVEHIIPKARLFDDSFGNKTISEVTVNRDKGDRTAYDYMQAQGQARFEEYLERVKNARISNFKKAYFLMPETEIPQDFISRQLQETRFITKKMRDLLQEVCRRVFASTGMVTDYLKHIWGLDDTLLELNEHRFSSEEIIRVQTKTGKTYKKIDGFSKRDDHRHHALDAVIIACTNQSIIQRLNDLNKLYSEQKGGIKSSGWDFPAPWNNFRQDVVAGLDNVLVSLKPGQKVATIGRNKNKQEKIHQKPLTPRGFLHKETVYGSILVREKRKLSTRFDVELLPFVANPRIKALLEERLSLHGNDPKKAFKNLDGNPIWINEKRKIALTEVPIFKQEFVVRYNLDGNFKADKSEHIVDKSVRELVKARLSQYDNNPKEAFKNLEENPVWLNQEKNITVKAVRCFARPSDLVPLHTNEKGKPIDFVSTRNNHHVAIYETPEGVFEEKVVTFWEAVQRKLNGQPVIEVSTPEGWNLRLSLQSNEMFVIGLNRETLEDAIRENDYSAISKHLYRVQSISSKDYFFRHHLATQLNDDRQMIRIKSLKKLLIPEIQKVKIDRLGRIALLDNS